MIYSTENREQLSAPCQHATIFYVRFSLPSNTLFRSVTIAPWLVTNWNQLEPIGTNWNQPFQCVFSVWCRLHGCKASRLHASWPALAIWGWLCSRTKNSDLWNRLNVNVDFFQTSKGLTVPQPRQPMHCSKSSLQDCISCRMLRAWVFHRGHF